MKKEGELIFVYNADAGLFSLVTDFAHKILDPGTYSCNLCKLTYGNIGMKKAWKIFLETLPQQKVFLHKDQFSARFPEFREVPLPAIFLCCPTGGLQEVATALEINQVSDLDALMALLRERLSGNDCL